MVGMATQDNPPLPHAHPAADSTAIDEELPTQKPIPKTPGPLATRLTQLYTASLAHTIRTCSYDNFARCFPTPARKRPEVLRAVWEQIVGKIESKAMEEFEVILEERKVVEGLNEFEGLVGEARGRREQREKELRGQGDEDKMEVDMPPPPHTLPPQTLYHAHLAPQLAPIQAELISRLRATQARNEELAEAIQRQREEMERLVAGLESVVKDLEGANEVLAKTVDGEGGAGDEEGVREELRTISKELGEVDS